MRLRLVLLCAAIVLVATLAPALGRTAPSTSASRTDPVPPLAFARISLVPAPANVVGSCRAIQARLGSALLCPDELPRATIGVSGWPPPALFVQPIGDFFHRAVAGVDISYGAPWEGRGWRAHRWRNRPCCFLHFDVFRRAPGKRAIPKGARVATLGGRDGLLAEAREDVFYGTELYWANHIRFLWRERGVDWVATLHTFGEQDTERLLGRLIAHLRPVDSIRSPREPGASVGVTPNAIAARGKSLWVASLSDGTRNHRGTVYRIGPSTGRVTARVHLHGGPNPHAVALAGGSVWVATSMSVARVDPRTSGRIGYVQAGRFPMGIAAADGQLWVADTIPFGRNGSLVSIDLATNRRVGQPIPLGRAPTALAATPGALWVVDALDATLTRVDPRRRRVVARVKVGSMPTAVAAGGRSVWVANTGEGTVSRIDQRTNRVVATLRVGAAPRAVAVGAGVVWVATTGGGSVRRIDPATDQITTVRRGLVDPLALAVAHGSLWVATNEGRLVRIRL